MERGLQKGVIISSFFLLALFGLIFLRFTGFEIASPLFNNTSNDSFPFCHEINASGSYYLPYSVLYENFSSSSCFSITASDITIDCGGNSLINSSAKTAFFARDVHNLTLRNCYISVAPDFGSGIIFENVSDSFILNSTFSHSYQGILLNTSLRIQVINSTFLSLAQPLSLFHTQGSYFSGNLFNVCNNSNTTFEGCYDLFGSSGNSFASQILLSASPFFFVTDYEGAPSSQNMLKDFSLPSPSVINFSHLSVLSENLTVINVTDDPSNEFISGGNSLARYWYYQLTLSSSAGGKVRGANVSISNLSNSVIASSLTDVNGMSDLFILPYAHNNGTTSLVNNYTVFITNRSYNLTRSFLLNSNFLLDTFTFTLIIPVTNTSSSSTTSAQTSQQANTPATAQDQTQDSDTNATPKQKTLAQPAPPSTPLLLHTANTDQLAQGYLVDLRPGEKVLFNLTLGDSHTLLLNTFVKNSLNSSVTVTLSSTPQTFSLSLGGQRRIDLDGNNYYDLLVSFTNLSSDNLPILTLKHINETSLPVYSLNVSFPASPQSIFPSTVLWSLLPYLLAFFLFLSLLLFLFLKKRHNSLPAPKTPLLKKTSRKKR